MRHSSSWLGLAERCCFLNTYSLVGVSHSRYFRMLASMVLLFPNCRWRVQQRKNSDDFLNSFHMILSLGNRGFNFWVHCCWQQVSPWPASSIYLRGYAYTPLISTRIFVRAWDIFSCVSQLLFSSFQPSFLLNFLHLALLTSIAAVLLPACASRRLTGNVDFFHLLEPRR